jgi:hypothetical protein
MITETPDWMKGSAQTDGNKDSMASNDLELAAVDGTEPAAAGAAAVDGPSASSGRPSDQGGSGCKYLKYFGWFISLCLLVLFIASATYQDNDESKKWLWILFYAFNAATVCIFVVAKNCPPSSEKLISAWGLAMISWGIGMVVWTVIDFVQAGEEDKEKDATENISEYTERAYDFGGAGFGLLSSVYHYVVWKCCCKEPKRDD